MYAHDHRVCYDDDGHDADGDVELMRVISNKGRNLIFFKFLLKFVSFTASRYFV